MGEEDVAAGTDAVSVMESCARNRQEGDCAASSSARADVTPNEGGRRHEFC